MFLNSEEIKNLENEIQEFTIIKQKNIEQRKEKEKETVKIIKRNKILSVIYYQYIQLI